MGKIRNLFVDYSIRLKDSQILVLGVIGAIIFSEIIIAAIHYLLWGGKISTELVFAGFVTPLLDALIILSFFVAIITRLRDTTHSLTSSKQMLEDVTQGISESILFLSKNFKILWGNKTAMQETGLSMEHLVGKTCHEATHHKYEPCAFPDDPCPIYEFTHAGKSNMVEHTHCDKDGNKSFVEVSVFPVRNDSGEINSFVHISRDISERKHIEQALKDSEERYRALIEQSGDGMYLIDAESKNILEANQSFQNLLGYSPEDISHMNIYDFVAHSKDDIDAKMRQMLNKDKYFIGERNYRKKDGTLLGVEVSASHIPYKGRGVFFLVLRDISQRKQLEQEREKLILELQAALANIRQLSGLLPICAGCKKIRNDEGYWEQIELYISEHSDAKFTHGFCSECVKKLYPDHYDEIMKKENK
ncbi:MAG: PAS domain S-box protein [Dissulfurispiraceae bacterium]|jgi:PAS domain S-box-containing protein